MKTPQEQRLEKLNNIMGNLDITMHEKKNDGTDRYDYSINSKPVLDFIESEIAKREDEVCELANEKIKSINPSLYEMEFGKTAVHFAISQLESFITAIKQKSE